ncbi:outer membrane protein assembly factor BamA [Rickettsiales bacterium LUAb2]
MLNKIFLLAILCCALATTSIFAVNIKKIEIVGNERVDSDYIKSLIGIDENTEYNQYAVSEAVKNIYNTDRFTDIKTDFSNSILTFTLKENPIVNKVSFSGNKHLKDDVLSKELLLSSNLPYSIRKLNNDKKRISDLYNKAGYLSPVITTKIENLKYNRINVTFEVTEGKKSTIDKIIFMGNNNYSASKLKSVILTREDRWWLFFNPNYVYDSNRISYDGELLKQFYIDNGFVNFAVLSSYVNIDNDSGYKLTFNINEGDRYKFGSLKLDIQIKDLAGREADFLPLLNLDGNIWFSRTEVNTIVARLKQKLVTLGYNFNDVDTDIVPNDYFKTIDITFKLKQTSPNIVEKINITGNTRTYDNVIRRVLGLREGDPYSASAASDARTNVYNTGFFSNIDMKNQPGSTNDKTVVNLNVTEQSTAFVSLGGGYSTQNGFSIEGKYIDQNVMGTGNSFNLTASIAQKAINFDTSLTDPYLFDRNMFGSIGIFNTLNNYQDTSSYSIQQIGARGTIGYNLTKHLSQMFTYRISSNNIYNVASDAPYSISSSKGKKLSSIISHTLQYDRRDNVIYPTKGYLTNLVTDYSGVGGDVYYLRNTVTASWYQALYGNVVFSAVSSAGEINKVKNNVDILISDKFFLGGSYLRGFDWSGVGPRNSNGDALGGNYMFRFSAQIDFPIPVVDNFGLLFHVFNDYGTVLDHLDDTQSNVIKSLNIRSSVGFGLSWRSPFGMIGLDWGWPINKQPGDRTERFLLNFGTRF